MFMSGNFRCDEPVINYVNSVFDLIFAELGQSIAYSVGDRVFHRITLQKGIYCAHCGEVLEKRCPNCGSLVHDGAVCSICGESYIAI